MAEKVYELIQFKAKEAWWQLTEKERESFIEQFRSGREEVGAETLAHLRTWSSPWRSIQLFVYPDMDAYHKHTVAVGPDGANAQRYFEFSVTLGYES